VEIESIVRAPVAFGRAAGIAMPTLDAITAICVRLGAAKGLYTPRFLHHSPYESRKRECVTEEVVRRVQ